MKIKHKSQKQWAAEGRDRQREIFRRRFIASYDTSPVAARAFIKGLLNPLSRIRLSANDPTHKDLLEQFIKENNLNGKLLLAEFQKYQPTP
jgi:hypothetical protein